MSVPLAISGLSGEYCSSASDAKLAGRMLAYRSSAFRSRRIPCSGRTGPTPHLGPPTAPTAEHQHSSYYLLAVGGACASSD